MLRITQSNQANPFLVSIAAPSVAGVVANWLGNPALSAAFPKGKVAESAKKYIQSLHWERAVGGNPVAYNGVHECYGYQPKKRQSNGDSPSLEDLMMDSCTSPQPATTLPAVTMPTLEPAPPQPTEHTAPPEPAYCYDYDQNCDVSFGLWRLNPNYIC